MRLIDADILMERIVDINNPDILTIGKVIGIIDTQSIAYDIDNVVEEIQDYSFRTFGEIRTETVIEILKKNLKEQK